MRALIVSQNSFVRHNFWASIVWSTILIRILPNFVLMLMSRFWYIVVSSLCLWKSRKQGLSHCSLSAHAQKLMRALRSRDVKKWRKQNKFLQTTSGHFSHLILVFFFLKITLAAYFLVIKMGRGVYQRAQFYLIETVFSHLNAAMNLARLKISSISTLTFYVVHSHLR